MNREPPTSVKRLLRQEVGFGCPIHVGPGSSTCGNPYLSYHHFDPPWHEKEHHNPEGMIALCGEHHPKADAGAFTKEQLRAFKANAIAHASEISGRFDWMRNRLLAVVGGNFYYETPIAVQYRDIPLVWFNRDEQGHFLLNIHMLTKSGEERIRMEDNSWLATGNVQDLESPPSGRLLNAQYANGDQIRVEFYELASLEAAQKKYPDARISRWSLDFPITAVEVHMRVANSRFSLGPKSTTLPGIVATGNFAKGCRVGFYIDMPI